MKRYSPREFFAVAILALSLATAGAHAQIYSDLYNFGSATGDPANPQFEGVLAQGFDGNLYSTTPTGGTGMGTVFKSTPQGAVSVLFNFNGTLGKTPYSGLTLGTDGNLYGTTSTGGSSNLGVIFGITPAGVLTVVHNFVSSDGYSPYSPPIQGADGNFHGTTVFGGTSAYGTVYKMTPAGVLTVLHSFDLTNGSSPFGTLVQGNDGNFYGTTYGGVGSNRYGIVFKVTGAGAFTILHAFALTHGGNAYAGLTLGKDGSFYGTTFNGGTVGYGVVFKITTSGVFTVLHSFTPATDGGTPNGGLVQGTDGNFYGATQLGGTKNHGTLYRITPAGVFTKLYSFDGTGGSAFMITLLQHTTGILYGDAYSGGTHSLGTLYSWNSSLPPYAALMSVSGKVGKTFGILGQGFNTATGVSFNGTAGAFKIVSDTYLTATVPAGATTGLVTVLMPGGNLKSKRTFRVTPSIQSFTPASGPVGTAVIITGVSLKQATSVTFGGVKATTFVVNSDTQVTANVPTGGKTGKIGIATPGGNATSPTTFTVTP